MAGTVSITEQTHTSMKKVKFEWTSTTGGTASATTTNAYSGQLWKCIVAGSTVTAPSTGYDVFINDADGYDVLDGLGVNLGAGTYQMHASSTGTWAAISPITAVSSKLTLSVADAGNAKKGEVILYIR